MSWTDERIDRLKALWLQGMTASQIADELGGVSRNAVIGKAHRLGLDARPSPVKPGEEKDKKPALSPALEADDPWTGLVRFLEIACEQHACDRGFKEVALSGVHGRAPIQGSVSSLSASGKRSRAIGSARPSCTGVLIASRSANSAPVVSRMPCRIGARK